MKLLVALVGLLAVFALATAEENSDVLDLTTDNFDSIVDAAPVILVEFYAPWCGHCKRLAPEYDVAATKLKESNIQIAKVDADNEVNKPLASRFGIRGFPTLKLFRKGKVVSDYQGERSADAIVSFMKKQSLPAISSLTSADEVKTFSGSDKLVAIGFFNDKDSSEYTAFTQAAEALRDTTLFGEVIGNADINKEFEVTDVPSVILFKKFDEGKNVLSKDGFNDVQQFLKTNSVPLIDEIGPNNYQSYLESGLPLAYLFVDTGVEGQKDDFLNKIKSIATAVKGKLNWVWIDWQKYAKHAERLGLSGKNVPAIALEKMQEGTHYAFDEATTITTEAIQSWVDKFLGGELQPTIKSEEIPTSNDGPVKVVVAKNFADVVLDPSKDVFVEFYAPWCGHCKKLAPIFDQLGETFQSAESVVIAKIDATANDVDAKYGVRGFPTLKLFPANNKESPIDYEGDRSLEDMITFVKTNAATKVDVPVGAHAHDEL